ncbi:MAG: hypothetical protein KDA89_07010, partial [Planctomycetaceae bacterium]|nr:hypothetical protein [Planctomycetaceae bacterium]
MKTNSAFITMAAGTALFSGLLFSSAAPAADRRALIDGVREIALPGVVGAVSVYGPQAFVVASAPVSDSV